MKILIIFLYVINVSFSANILGLMHVASPSHSIWNNVLVNALADRGHNLTVIISDLPKNPKDIYKNITYFTVNEVYSAIHSSLTLSDFFGLAPHQTAIDFCTYCTTNCESAIATDGFNKFMKTYDKNFKFDIILYDFICGPCLLGLLERFNYPPLVGISAYPVPAFGNSFAGGHNHPGYINFHSALLNPVHNFVDRLYNNLLFVIEMLYKKYYFYPKLDELAKAKHFPKNMKTVGDLEKYVAISLVNSHPAVITAEPIPPNVIEIGGLQLVDPDPLPKDLENFIVAAKKGAVLFSLGTNVRPEDMTDSQIATFISTLKKFPEYNFLWKFDTKRIKIDVPKNILIRKFFPQRDILAHPNIKAFITHSGGLSTQESIWYGVPMVCLPLFGDQVRNTKDGVEKGIAVKIDFLTITEKSFETGLREMLENPKYEKNIKLMSKRFRDRPSKPLDTAIWWIEYMLRHPNPDHLKPLSLQMNYFTANSIDFIAIVLFSLQFVFLSIVTFIWFCCCKTSKTSNTQKKQKLK